MKVLSWNCRGAISPRFYRCLKEILRQYYPDVLFLMEPRVQSQKGRRILQSFSYTQYVAVEADGFSGGLWCFWNENDVALEILEASDQYINVAVLRDGVVDWVLTLVYASPMPSIRGKLWRKWVHMAGVFCCPWTLI